ncbi:uncharacterized protein A1O9_04628 [Exophiala aquamarina CBS 119918]|uniref:Uncharacterized protein n=1 Tax=Exophiala aquamarina CBS 119918 TaxID=1182545 RepID=A0A072PW61_9EURO|nr:uncharacterized protein A1O9_04628 [Exophiala aquamarina CBS 119918]KEF59780.1 hypothetical protein A1O9_04628 [Exophiala aquamarina CBS 119918]
MEQDLMEDIFVQDDLRPSIAEHALQCDSLFRKYMALPEIAPDPTVMDDQLARFTLWASNMDVYGPLNVSLDYRLRYSPTVVDIIHQLLDVICDTLMSLATIVKPVDEPPQTPSRKKQRISRDGRLEITMRDDSDASDMDSDEDRAEENISKITYTIGGTVTRLFRLSNAVRKSAKANRAQKMGRYKADEETKTAIAELRLYTECYIRFRFPLAPESLHSALVEANALRLRRLCYQRSHRRRIDLKVQQPQAEPSTVQLPKVVDSSPAVHFGPSIVPKPATINKKSDPTLPPPIPVTNATTARQTAVAALYAKSTTEVPRAKSVLVNNKLSFPPMPPTSECPYCGVIVEFKGSARLTMWHNHVIGDLEPYICISAHCMDSSQQEPSPLTFETSKAWISHLQNAHRSTWECRAPSHHPIIFEREVEYQEHSIKEHGVPPAHVGTLSSAARRPLLNKILECPFGDDFQLPEKVESSTVFSSGALQSHVAAHMKEIALLTLQKVPSHFGDTAESVDSGMPLEDDGPGFAKLRGSMYSVLDDEALDFQDEAGDVISNNHEEDISPSVERLDLDGKDANGITNLHQAVRARNLALVRSLIDQGENLRSRTNDGRTALHYACVAHDVDMMTLLLDANDNAILNLGDKNGLTPLHYAAKRGFTGVMQLLVDRGVDTHITDNNGFSAYLWAVVANQEAAAVKMLILGVNVDFTGADGKTALGWAASLNHLTMAQMLVGHGAAVMSTAQNTQMAPLGEAAAFGGYPTVLFLLDQGADPNYRDRNGWSAIHWAAEEGHEDIVHLLLKGGADVNAVSSYGTSPLHCAANGGRKNIVRVLLQYGADPLRTTCHGWTPLHHAAFAGHSHVVQFLLGDDRIRSNASLQDNHGWSILHLAIQSRDLATVGILLNSSVITETRTLCDESGLTAEEWLDLVPTSHSYQATSNLAFGKSRCCRAVTGLRQAVAGGNIPLTEFFLERGHVVNDTDSGRRTALYYAAKKGFLLIMDLLLDRGADPNILPVGRMAWEEFISDDMVLSRLRRAGYRKRSADPEIEQQIRLFLRAPDETSVQVPYRSVSNPQKPLPAPKHQSPEPVSKVEVTRSGLSNFFKRLRSR